MPAPLSNTQDPQPARTSRSNLGDRQATKGMVRANGTNMGTGIAGSLLRLRNRASNNSKGLAYEFGKTESQFRRCISTWRSKVKELEELLDETLDSQKLKNYACDYSRTT